MANYTECCNESGKYLHPCTINRIARHHVLRQEIARRLHFQAQDNLELVLNWSCTTSNRRARSRQTNLLCQIEDKIAAPDGAVRRIQPNRNNLSFGTYTELCALRHVLPVTHFSHIPARAMAGELAKAGPLWCSKADRRHLTQGRDVR